MSQMTYTDERQRAASRPAHELLEMAKSVIARSLPRSATKGAET